MRAPPPAAERASSPAAAPLPLPLPLPPAVVLEAAGAVPVRVLLAAGVVPDALLPVLLGAALEVEAWLGPMEPVRPAVVVSGEPWYWAPLPLAAAALVKPCWPLQFA